MRLLNTTNLTFGEFFGQRVPEYCILSHRWSEDEVKYQDIASGKVNRNSTGYLKLIGACRLARKLGWSWIWIDAACIDKASSSELGEAINSMMKWYSQAAFCIAHLADVPRLQSAPVDRKDSIPCDARDFRHSVWWTRGWTLQELIAPQHVYFYNSSFEYIGSKAKLSREISNITGIEAVYLDGRKSFTEACIATRMSWSATRTCTRKEDEAYCLLGLMQVNMPLLYGEGKMAFMRLQLQILSQSSDETIFAWLAPRSVSKDQPFGMLAESPRYFVRSRHLRCTTKDAPWRLPYSFSNKGLEFSQYTGLFTGSTNPIYSTGGGDGPERTLPGGTYMEPYAQTRLTLRCTQLVIGHRGKVRYKRVADEVRRIGNAWYRVNCNRFVGASEPLEFSGLIQTYYVAQPNMATQLSTHRPVSVKASAMARQRCENIRREKEQNERHRSKLMKNATMLVAVAGVVWHCIEDKQTQ